MAIFQSIPLGQPVPRRPHAISVQLRTWDDVVSLGLGQQWILEALKGGYPRTVLHPSVKNLFDVCTKSIKESNENFSLLLFLDEEMAKSCKEYLLSVSRKRIQTLCRAESVKLLIVEFQPVYESSRTVKYLHAVVFPRELSDLGTSFWRLTGTGISSRLAENCLRDQRMILRPATDTKTPTTGVMPHPVFGILRSRIANLIDRTPINDSCGKKITKSDVSLYPSGMSAIYHVHKTLLNLHRGESAILGFTYELTIKMLETYGPGCHFFGFGSDKELDELEEKLQNTTHEGRQIQALWCECPSNPLLRTVNFRRVKEIATDHNLIVIVDETIGSFANVNVLDVADIVVSSLTKYFNGFGDVLAGSVILNPNSRHFVPLSTALSGSYVNRLYVEDALRLESNSKSYLDRTKRVNETALYLVNNLLPLVSDQSSPIKSLYYPSVCWSRENYHRQMRPETDDFKPGYGGLFTIEFQDTMSAASFFDNLQLCKGPSFGADITIALPYVQMVLQKEKEWAERNGLRETIIRIAVGLEQKDDLLGIIERALRFSNETTRA